MSVADYIADAPAEHRPILEHLRQKIREHLPDADEQIGSSGFPVYTMNGEWTAGFAWRAKCPMLYIMASGVLDEYADALGVLRSGRSCVEWRVSRSVTLDQLDALADRMLAQAAG